MGHQIPLMPVDLRFAKEMSLITNNHMFLLALVAHSPLLVCTSSTAASSSSAGLVLQELGAVSSLACLWKAVASLSSSVWAWPRLQSLSQSWTGTSVFQHRSRVAEWGREDGTGNRTGPSPVRNQPSAFSLCSLQMFYKRQNKMFVLFCRQSSSNEVQVA